MKFIVPYTVRLAVAGSPREALDHAEFCGTSPAGSWFMQPEHALKSVTAYPPLFRVLRLVCEAEPEEDGLDSTEVVFRGGFVADTDDPAVAKSAVESLGNEGWWGDNASISSFEVGTPFRGPTQRTNYLAIELTIDHVPDEAVGWPDPAGAVERGIRKALEPYKFIHVGEIRSLATTAAANDHVLLLTDEELEALSAALSSGERIGTFLPQLQTLLATLRSETEETA